MRHHPPIVRSLARVTRLAVLCALLWPAAPLAAAPVTSPATLGGDGHLHQVVAGPYAEILPGHGMASPTAPALALVITRSDGSVERLLVPGTEGSEIENSASLVYEDGSRTLFVLWQSVFNVIHSRLHLVGLGPDGWSEVIEISGNPFGYKSAPQLAVTRDTFTVDQAHGARRNHQRTIVHLLWWEESGGEPEVRYAPIVFLDGSYVGWNPVYRLDRLVASSARSSAREGARRERLAEAPRLQPGDNPRSVVIAFVHGETGQMVSATLDVLPGEIGFLAQETRRQVIELGIRLIPGSLDSLPEEARAQIVDLGRRLGLHPGMTQFVANSVAASLSDAIAQGHGDDLVALADGARAQIVDLGARLDERGFDRGSATAATTVVEIAGGDEPPSLLRLAPVTDRPAPPVERSGRPSVFVSSDAEHLLVAWPERDSGSAQPTALIYRESDGAGWGELHSLSLGPEMSLAQAHEILARRVREKR